MKTETSGSSPCSIISDTPAESSIVSADTTGPMA